MGEIIRSGEFKPAELVFTDTYWGRRSTVEAPDDATFIARFATKKHPELTNKALGFLSGQEVIELPLGTEFSFNYGGSNQEWYLSPGTLLAFDIESLAAFETEAEANKSTFGLASYFDNTEEFNQLFGLSANELILKGMDKILNKEVSTVSARKIIGTKQINEDGVKLYQRRVVMGIMQEHKSELGCMSVQIQTNLDGTYLTRTGNYSPLLTVNVPFVVGETMEYSNWKLQRCNRLSVIETGKKEPKKSRTIQKLVPSIGKLISRPENL